MTEISWKALMRDVAARHLVVGAVPSDDAAGSPSSLKLRVALLARLARALRLGGFYSLTDLPERSGNEVRCALEREADAVRLGEAVSATTEEPIAGWASVRRFTFDAASETAINATLQSRAATRRTRKKRAANVL
jgi:hypothetical protein